MPSVSVGAKLVTQLYKSFIESRFLYQKSEMRSVVKEAKHKGVCIQSNRGISLVYGKWSR